MESFIDPISCFPPDIEALIQELIVQCTNELQKQHLTTGYTQIQQYLQLGQQLTFGQWIQQYSNDWKQHVDIVERENDFKATYRNLLTPPHLQKCEGIDVKVHCKGCPDDKLYARHQYARENMPRGNFIAKWMDENRNIVYFPLIRAYPKFTGHEDDGELDSTANSTAGLSKYFIQPMHTSTSVISTQKENGEAAHLSVLKTKAGQYYYIVGSKNVHLMITGEEDVEEAIQLNTPRGSYDGARPIAIALMKMLQRIEPRKRALFCDFLAFTRITASFELLCPDHQHVELLSHLTEDTPVLFGFSLPLLYQQVKHISGIEICLNPVLGYEFAKYLGIRTVFYEILSYGDGFLESYKQTHLHYIHHEEGRVNLYCNAQGHVIGLQKYKTAWYVCLRAIREQMKNMLRKFKKASPTRQAIEQAMQQRMNARFNSICTYLDANNQVIQQYCNLGKQFATYLLDQIFPYVSEAKVKKLLQDITNMFPVVWEQFLQQTNQTDHFQ